MNILISGKVIRGENIGEKQGYPTANLSPIVLRHKKISSGVYIAKTKLKNKWYRSILIIGVPGVKIQKKGKVESYLLDYNKQIYGCQLVIEVVKKIRPINKYKNTPALIARIKKDISVVRDYFK